MLMKRGEQEGMDGCHAFNTFFCKKIMEGGQANVRRWTSKVDIFKKKLLLVPVHLLDVHWCLAVRKSSQY